VLYWCNGGGATPSKNLYTLDMSQGAPLALPAPRTLPVKPSGGMTCHQSQDLLYVYDFSPSDTLYGLDPDTLGTTIVLSQPAANPDPYLSDARLGNALIAGDTFAVSLRARFPNDGTTVGSIVSEICTDAGLTGADIDTVALTQGVHGYVRAQPMEAQAAITSLMTAFLFEYKLKFLKKMNATVAELNEARLGAHEAGQEPVDPLVVTRTQEAEMPQAVSLHFVDYTKDYLQGSAQRTRVISAAVNALQLDLPIAMNATKAKRLCTKLMNVAWAERHRYELATTVRSLDLDPADVIAVTSEGARHSIRITRIDFGAPGLVRIEGLATHITTLPAFDDDFPEDDEDAEPIFEDDEEEEAPPDEFPSQSPVTIPASRTVLLDIPLLRDADNDPGFYAGLCGYRPEGWTGATLFMSTDGGGTYLPTQTVTNPAAIGGATNVLGDATTTLVDRGNTVNIVLTQGTLQSDTEANVFAGKNAAALGAEGRWEIIQWETATLEADGSYTLSNLLRGRKGTEQNVGKHQVGDVFIALTPTTVIRLHTSTSELDQPRLYNRLLKNSIYDAR
jgi:putative tail protein